MKHSQDAPQPCCGSLHHRHVAATPHLSPYPSDTPATLRRSHPGIPPCEVVRGCHRASQAPPQATSVRRVAPTPHPPSQTPPRARHASSLPTRLIFFRCSCGPPPSSMRHSCVLYILLCIILLCGAAAVSSHADLLGSSTCESSRLNRIFAAAAACHLIVCALAIRI